MAILAQRKCIPCSGEVPAMASNSIEDLLKQLAHNWKVVAGHHLLKSFTFPDFQMALEFTNKVGAVAEQEGHHPDIYLSWGRVEIKIWTHKIDGLTESDFILAAKIEEIPH